MLKKILTSKVFLVVILIGLGFLTFQLLKITNHKYKLQSELKPLNNEIERVEKEKEELSENFDYFKSESYAEKEARARLNLKKEGEKVVIVSPGEELQNQDLNPSLEKLSLGQQENEPSAKLKANQEKKESSRVGLWWNYFFGE